MTSPETNSNSRPLKMVVSNRHLIFCKRPPFSGAFVVSFREGNCFAWAFRLFFTQRFFPFSDQAANEKIPKRPNTNPRNRDETSPEFIRWSGFSAPTSLHFAPPKNDQKKTQEKFGRTLERGPHPPGIMDHRIKRAKMNMLLEKNEKSLQVSLIRVVFDQTKLWMCDCVKWVWLSLGSSIPPSLWVYKF